MDWAAGKGFITAGDTRLEYGCWGPSPDQAPTIVLLHEGLGCVALWRDFPERLAAATGMGVLAYSRAGYGQSDGKSLPWSINYMTDEAVEVLPLVLDAIGFRSGILMGHSDGATIASIYCGSVEDARVRGLIVMAPHYFTEPMGLAAIAQAKVAYEGGDLKSRLAKYHRDVENAFRGWNDSWLHPEFEAWNVGDVTDYLRIPALAIQGRQDEYGTLAQIDEIATRSYAPVEVSVIDDCGHSPHLDQPDQVLAAVSDFTAHLWRIEAAEPEGV
ncbi:MAG: alpha/beta fold hydrolase [Thalassovita sp.]